MRKHDITTATKTSQSREASPWVEAREQLHKWDPASYETCLKMTTNPRTSGVLPGKTVELISVALNAASAALNPEDVRRHIRAAVAAGATREEILMALKMASMMSIHSRTRGGSILLEELPPSDLGTNREAHATPTCDKMREAGRWNPAWDTFFYLDPVWTDELIATGVGIDATGVMPPKLVELLSVALHASPLHRDAAATRRHMRAATRAGASPQEIIEALNLCVVHGV